MGISKDYNGKIKKYLLYYRIIIFLFEIKYRLINLFF